jgi:hypothetical protein
VFTGCRSILFSEIQTSGIKTTKRQRIDNRTIKSYGVASKGTKTVSQNRGMIGGQMRINMRKLLAGMSVLSMSVVGVVLGEIPGGAVTATIVGGNPVVAAPYTDGYSNFVIVDGNNPISGSGLLTNWSFWAAAAGNVELVIVAPGASLSGGGSIVYTGPVVNVTSDMVGSAITRSLPGGAWVQAGDEVGLYFDGNAGVVPFSGIDGGGTGGTVLYTSNYYGASNLIAAGSNLSFEGAVNRVYSVSVAGFTSGAGCKDGGYMGAFSNQGACVSAFATQGLVPIGAPNN